MSEKKFDQNKYIQEYQKKHYSGFCAKIPPELKAEIDKYCSDMKISKTEFLRRAIKVLDDYNNI